MVDNLKSAVLRRLIGVAPVLNPRYVDYARHQGFQIAACNLAAGWEKGRVENGVGYVKKNLLNGLSLPDFSAMNTAAQIWLTEIANVRIHGETHQRPVDLFAQERPHLRPANINPCDLGRGLTTRVSPLVSRCSKPWISSSGVGRRRLTGRRSRTCSISTSSSKRPMCFS
jgi:hypothetical protein